MSDEPTPLDPPPGQDATVTALRGALTREAARVSPDPDGLRRIREAIDAGHAPARPGRTAPHGPRRWIPLLAAAATVLVLGGVGTAALLGGRDQGPSPAPGARSTVPVTQPSRPPATPTATGGAPVLPVYWVGASRTRLWLYREFVPTSARTASDRADAALTTMLAGRPADPDYSSPWRASPASVDVGAGGITVNLTSAAFEAPGVDTERAKLAVQELVHTVTAATQMPVPVRILVDGRTGYRAWGLVRLGDPISRDTSAVAPIWVTDPQQGRQVGSPVTVSGVGSAFEGTLAWELTSADGQVVDSGSVQGGSVQPGPFRFTLTLGPGTYTVTVWAPDESGGESPEGSRMYPDSKTFTVN